MTAPRAMDIASLHQAYGEGYTPQAMIDRAFSELTRLDDPGIFISLADLDNLAAQVMDLGPFDPVAKPLWGIPFAIKDNIDLAGLPTTAACPDFAYDPSEDATVVARLKQAGAIAIGKTNLDQFATGLVGLRSPYAPPRNAVDPALVPGGSSSGSAVAVAHGIVTFALGTDTAGSGRVPAGLNNIVGLKPSLGALSNRGMVPACRTLDCMSVFALTVDDAHAVFAAAAGADPADPFSRDFPAAALGEPGPATRIGIPREEDRRFFGDPAMATAFEQALAELEALGCELVSLPFADFFAVAELLYEGAWVAERFAAIEAFIADHESSLHPVTRQIITGARGMSAADAFRGIYALQELRARLAPLIEGIDMLCVPTAPTHYTVDQVLADPIGTNSRLGTYTNFVNLLDLCGMAVPTGDRRDGWPASVTLLAPAGHDGRVASLARRLHHATGKTMGATGWPLARPEPLEPDALNNGRIDLMVVGAHLSGMPLNGELLKLGAVLRGEVVTAPLYRLYALVGGALEKPGLVRDGAGNGQAIAGEVWSLAPEAFGRFVAAIPAPLGIGTVALGDGSTVKGFLCEPAGLDGARDISSLGGWRAYQRDKGNGG